MQALVAKKCAAAHGDHDRMSEAIERLTNSLALTIAVACNGNAECTNTMTEGVCAHMFERVVDHAKLARFMSAVRK
jgi:hypothetical protein